MTITFRQRILRAVAAIIAAAALTALYLATVKITGIMPKCLFRLATGWSCPGCGSQRALHALLHGNLREALEMNLLLPAGITYLILLGAGYLFADNRTVRKLYTRITSPRALLAVAAVIAAWTVARNLAGI